MIIDAHAHADEYKLFGWIDPPERVIGLMDRAGIDISIVTTYAEAPFNPSAVDNLVNYVNRFPDRLLGFVRIDPKGAEEAVRVFEHTIRSQLMQGQGLIQGEVRPALEQPNKGLSADLDALAAYSNGHKVPRSPFAKQGLSESAERGREIFPAHDAG